MKTKLTSVTYLGYTAMDRRFSTSMLPWLLREIRANRIRDKLSVSIEDGFLKAYNGNFEPVIVHRLVDIIRASQVPGRPDELFYILFNEKEGLLNCFLFRAATALEVTDLFTQMREPSPGAASPRGSNNSLNNGSVTRNIGFSSQNSTEHLPWSNPAISLPGNCNSNLTSDQTLVRSSSNASALTSLSADLSPSESHFFEVLYIGKVRISQRKVPETLIDDALQKFAQHEAEKALRRRHSLLSSTGTSLYSNDSKENLADEKTEVADTVKVTFAPSTTPLEPEKGVWKSAETLTPKTETKAVDDEFDMFTKERVVKTSTAIQRPSSIPLEPSVLVLNVPKNLKNLGTVSEDEERDLKAVISETASDISKFCEERIDKSFNTDLKDNNPFTKDTFNKNKEVILKSEKVLESGIKNNFNKIVEDNKEISFGEIGRRPNNVDGNRRMPENKPFLRDRSASIGTINLKTPIAQLIGEQNRTMLFQVGRSELRLISPDRKQILLHREFKDVASCVLGRYNKDHFGFVCRETNDTYACYVFKCESDSVATEVVNAIKQAFVSHADFLKKTRDKSPNMTCEHCPMLWYHRLCHDIEGLNDKKTHAFVLRRIEQLPEDEQDIIITKYQGGTNHIYETGEHNAFLMMLLRAHCEGKQQRHVHDTAENRSEFLNQFLGGGAILVKKLAKRSFSSGFDHLLKRKASRDELTPHDVKKLKMKTKLTSVTYLGYTAMDRRFSTSMLPWLLREIRANRIRDKLSVSIEDGFLKAYNGNFEPVIVHRLVDIIRASQVPGRPDELFYILFNEKEGLLNCFLFRAATALEVTDLFTQMREPSPGAASPRGSNNSLNNGSVTRNIGFSSQNSTEHLPWSNPAISLPGNCNSNLTSDQTLVRSSSNASALTSLSADLSPSESHFFEVLYIGKVRISQRKVPETLIDDALQKFAQHEAEKALRRRHSLLSSTGTSLYSNDSKENLADEKTEVIDTVKVTFAPSTTPLEPEKGVWKSAETLTPKTETKAVDDEFDMFTKERVVKTSTAIQRPSSIPLEPSVLVLNVPKNLKNLGTVSEDEERDLKAVISETASDISKFCEERIDKSFNTDLKDNNPFTKDTFNKNKEVILKSEKVLESGIKNNFNKIVEENKEISFGEIGRRHNNVDGNRRMPENKPFLRDRSASIGTINLKTPIAQLIGEQNRTMLFQVGRSELRLISPDRKQILLHREFKDVASCVLGRYNKDHFGFVCRETNDTYACYVFKCESDSVATEVVNAIKQAFVSHADFLKKTRDKSPNMTCEHCPMLWYHRLCHDIEGLNDKKTHAFVLRRIEQLPEDEQDIIITKYQGGTNHIYETGEHNAFLMMLLRAHCEGKQQRHVHDTAENRSEFLNQFLGGGAILVKKLAKRSFSSGFDHLLKRKASRDELTTHDVKKEASPLPTPTTPEIEPTPSELAPIEIRSKSLSPAVISLEESASPKHAMTPTLEEGEEDEDEDVSTPVNSPMMDIFLKVSDRGAGADSGGSLEPDATWRQAIYRTVIQPTDMKDELAANLRRPSVQGRRNKEELRQLWKMAIEQTILLVRMEKENARLRESEESSAVRRIKLEYTELGGSDTGTTLMWDSLLSRDRSQPTAKVDRHMLTQAVKQGVPRVTRGAVWYFLAEQASLNAPPPDTVLFPNYHMPYKTLLSSLTKHHHAILIDLGRTFPKHSYFASALGPGQLALYNILKAYSLLDPDVGYCQGLSFVAGVLLLHTEEAEAFILLRHLMFRRGLRKQYLPDMAALQVQLYQLSRLLRDHEPELHAKLESLDISPALYAAPWMLTLFTSQFPLGFVVRVFDLIFLDSLDVVMSISLAILSCHRDGLMLCESCEEAAEYLKHKLPEMTHHQQVINKVHTLDISRQLADYAVEYAVLREEMPRVATLSEHNRQLTADASRMTDELDSAMDAITTYQKNQARLESVNKSLEQQLTLLSRFISNPKQEMPMEIKRIVQSHSKRPSFSSKLFSTKFSSTDEEKLPKTGVSTPNLFAKINKEEFAKLYKEELAKVSKEESAKTEAKESPEKERKHFIMKKSQSVHSGLIAPNVKPLKVFEQKSEIQEDLKELRKKTSFFASTHEQIREERLFEQQLKHSFDENLKKLDTKLSPKSYIDDLNLFQSRKSVSLNIGSEKCDSGFVTPLTPEQKTDSCSTISHPLSDVDVDIKFDGQSTKLKQIRPNKCLDGKT